MYACGLIFLSLGLTDVLILSPVMLLLTTVYLFLDYRQWRSRDFLMAGFIFLISYLVEAVGVNYGFIFGNYTYGNNLGPKIFGTPLIIGLNWFLLTVASVEIIRPMAKSKWLRIFLGGVFMVLWDLMMEPIAPKMDFWEFETSAGLHNSVGRFGLAILCQIIWQWRDQTPIVERGRHVFFSQLIFFSTCYLIL